jgi:hypothetical protein
MAMSEPHDPPRWSAGGAGAPEAFAELVREDEAVALEPAQLARVLEGVAQQVARPELTQAYRALPPQLPREQPPGRTGASGAAATRSAAGLLWKIGGGLCMLAVMVGLWQARPAARERAAPQQVAAKTVVAPVRAPAAVPEPAASADEGASAAREPEGAAAAAAPAAARPAHARTPRQPSAGGPDDPAAELALLESAQRALRDDPAQTLALAERHRARFARGQFEQEREMLAIEALLRLHRDPAARGRARTFERRFPASSHLPRLRGLFAR